MSHLNAWQWSLLALGALVTGLCKTGIAARAPTGALLPLLLCADVFGVAFFRKHASWPHLFKLFPWVIVGVVSGYFALDKISNAQVQRLIGGIILAMVALHAWRH